MVSLQLQAVNDFKEYPNPQTNQIISTTREQTTDKDYGFCQKRCLIAYPMQRLARSLGPEDSAAALVLDTAVVHNRKATHVHNTSHTYTCMHCIQYANNLNIRKNFP